MSARQLFNKEDRKEVNQAIVPRYLLLQKNIGNLWLADMFLASSDA